MEAASLRLVKKQQAKGLSLMNTDGKLRKATSAGNLSKSSQAYIQYVEGGKVYRIPVEKVRTAPSTPKSTVSRTQGDTIKQNVSPNNDTKAKALESRDGNWVLKPDLVKKQRAQASNLQSRNKAVSDSMEKAAVTGSLADRNNNAVRGPVLSQDSDGTARAVVNNYLYDEQAKLNKTSDYSSLTRSGTPRSGTPSKSESHSRTPSRSDYSTVTHSNDYPSLSKSSVTNYRMRQKSAPGYPINGTPVTARSLSQGTLHGVRVETSYSPSGPILARDQHGRQVLINPGTPHNRLGSAGSQISSPASPDSIDQVFFTTSSSVSSSVSSPPGTPVNSAFDINDYPSSARKKTAPPPPRPEPDYSSLTRNTNVYKGPMVKVTVPHYSDSDVLDSAPHTNSLPRTKSRFHSDSGILGAEIHDDIDLKSPKYEEPRSPTKSVSTPRETPRRSRSTGTQITRSAQTGNSIYEGPNGIDFQSIKSPNISKAKGQLSPRSEAKGPVSQMEWDNAPRTVVLQKGRGGFGFVLRGAKSQQQAPQSPSRLEFSPTSDFPALQYLDRVDKGSMADKAGLKPGDFLLEINGENVVNATHEHTVRLIKNSGDTLAMKVVTVKPASRDGLQPHMDGTMTLPTKGKKAPKPPMRNPHTSLTPNARNKAQVVLDSLTELEKLDQHLSLYDDNDADHNSNTTDPLVLNRMAAEKGVDPNNKTASIRSRQFKRVSSVPIEGVFSENVDTDRSASNQERPVVAAVPRVYASPQELKAKVSPQGNGTSPYGRHVTRVELDDAVPAPSQQQARGGHNTSYSSQKTSPNTVTNVHLSAAQHNDKVTYDSSDPDRIYAVPFKGPRYGSTEKLDQAEGGYATTTPPRVPTKNIPPPPNHSAPSPPDEDVVPINTRSPHMYANISEEIQRKKASESPYESSFRPGINARLSQEPEKGPALSKLAMKPPAPHPEPDVHSNRSSVSATSSLSSASSGPRLREPAPDYEPEPDYPGAEVRDGSWAVRNGGKTLTSTPAKPAQVTPKTPTSPEENQMSAFSNAIKMAAVARERRAEEEEVQKKAAAPSPPQKPVQKPPVPSSTGAPPPPPTAPPPPPVAPPAPEVKRSPMPVLKKAPLPEHIQKQMEADKKREDSHAALMAAVLKRRNVVDEADMNEVADSIETRIQKTKKLQTVVYKSDQTKEVKAPPAPVKAPLLTNVPEYQKKPEPKKEMQKDQGIASNTNGVDIRASITSTSSTNFLAAAEKARMEYLEKRQQATLDRTKKPGDSPAKDASAKQQAPPPPPLVANHKSASPVVAKQQNTAPPPPKQQPPPVLGDFAQVIADKAMRRQKSAEGMLDNSNNNASAAGSLEVKGATTDYSYSDVTPKTSRALSAAVTDDSKVSVADRMRAFNSNQTPNNSSPTVHRTVYAASNSNTRSTHYSSSPSQGPTATTSPQRASNGVHNSTDYTDFVIPPPPVFEGGHNGASLVAPPPPPEFGDFVDNSYEDVGEFIPPPMGFEAPEPTPAPPQANSLRSVVKSQQQRPPLLQSTFTHKPVETWQVQDVTDWLESLELREHCQKFSARRINGQALMQLDRNELIGLGVTQVGHRMTIERAIKKALVRK